MKTRVGKRKRNEDGRLRSKPEFDGGWKREKKRKGNNNF
jgi:hypothetical protein